MPAPEKPFEQRYWGEKIWFDEAERTMSLPMPILEQMRQDFLRAANEREKREENYYRQEFKRNFDQQTYYTSYQKPSPPPPENFLITYLGGPRNSTQDFLPYQENSYIKEGVMWMVRLNEPMKYQDYSPDKKHSETEVFSYLLTFIPRNETAFTTDQCVIAVFQP